MKLTNVQPRDREINLLFLDSYLLTLNDEGVK